MLFKITPRFLKFWTSQTNTESRQMPKSTSPSPLDENSNANYDVNHGLFIAESRRRTPFESKVDSIDAGEASKPEEASTT